MPFTLPADAKPGDVVLAHCPVCDKLVHVLVLPGDDQYIPNVFKQLEDALKAHEQQTGHDKAARAQAQAQARHAKSAKSAKSAPAKK